MPNLKHQIEEARKTKDALVEALFAAKNKLDILQDARRYCKHEFDPPKRGLEHEGGQCRHCDINQLFAPTLASLAPVVEIGAIPLSELVLSDTHDDHIRLFSTYGAIAKNWPSIYVYRKRAYKFAGAEAMPADFVGKYFSIARYDAV